MLSILIPTYNYDVLPLITELESQANKLDFPFEIICIDDYSSKFKLEKEKINHLNNTSLILLKENIGRSAIRNLLAQKANYNNLLFIDAGTFPKSDNFIKNYTADLNQPVVLGGMVAEEIAPKKPYKLRWLYTKEREVLFKNGNNRKVLTSTNFLIKKEIIQKHVFDETITKYGYEDFVFFNTLKSQEIKLHFINNPVIHDSKESADIFIKKTEDSIQNLINLSKENKNLFNNNKVIKLYKNLKLFKLDLIIKHTFKMAKPLLKNNFKSAFPSLFLFDFYRLGYFCVLKSEK